MEKPAWKIDRLGAPALAPDLARGVRGVVAMLVPFYLGRRLGSSELAWAALGGWLCTISDPGGARSARATTLIVFTLAGAVLVALGEAAVPVAGGALLVMVLVAFGASILRAIGATGASLSTPFVVVTAIAVGTRPSLPIPHALGFAAGAAWAVLLSSVLWPVWNLFPLRIAVASTWQALAAYAHALHSAIRRDLPPHDPRWASIARAHQRSVRSRVESAAAAGLALRARRTGESVLGSNLLALLGSADAQHRLLIAFADELETADARQRSAASALLSRLASTYEGIAQALARRRLSRARPVAIACATRDTGPLGRRLLDASVAAAKVAAEPGVVTSAEANTVPSFVGRVVRDDFRSLRDAFSLRSTYFRHAIRVTIAVAVAQSIGHFVSPSHVAWVTVTTAAVLQPYPGVTVKRAFERAFGTLLGGLVALGVIVFVHSPIVLTFLLVPFGIAAVATRPRSHRLFVFFLTPLFVLLAERWQGDWWTAAARVGDALVGAAIALVAALVFPSREQPRLVDAIRVVLGAIRRYAEVVLAAHTSGRSGSPEVLCARRDVAVAMGTAETSLERALSEPLRSRRRIEDALMLLTYARRLANALTTLDVQHASSADEHAAADVIRYVDAVYDAVVHRREPPRSPEIDPSVPSSELLARIVRQAELVGSRRLPPRLLPAHERRRLVWAAPRSRTKRELPAC